MGGIVGAEAVLDIAGDSIPATSGPQEAEGAADVADGGLTPTTFPHILGLLSYDTPFLGISPGVIAHGAEDHYKTVSSAYNAFTEISSAFGLRGGRASSSSLLPKQPSSPEAAAAAPPSSAGGNESSGNRPATQRQFLAAEKPSAAATSTAGRNDVVATPSGWQSWRKYAMFAGAAGAAAAGGAAAIYSQRDKIQGGWDWVSGHLEFVGALVRAEELRGRVKRMGQLASTTSSGFKGSVIFYTLLDHPAGEKASVSARIGSEQRRTFVKLPASQPSSVESSPPRSSHMTPSHTNGARLNKTSSTTTTATGPTHSGKKGCESVEPASSVASSSSTQLQWLPAPNAKVSDEITAHTSMFFPTHNPGFYVLVERSVEAVMAWVLAEFDKFLEDEVSAGYCG